MASIRTEILIGAKPESVWAAIRDIGALHTRLVPGFVVDTRLEPGARIVTFGNGMTVREQIWPSIRRTAGSSGRPMADRLLIITLRRKSSPMQKAKQRSCGLPIFYQMRPRRPWPP